MAVSKFGAYVFLLIGAIVHIGFRADRYVLQGAEFLIAVVCNDLRSVVFIKRCAIPRISYALGKIYVLIDLIDIIESYVDANGRDDQSADGALVNGALTTIVVAVIRAAAIAAAGDGGGPQPLLQKLSQPLLRQSLR